MWCCMVLGGSGLIYYHLQKTRKRILDAETLYQIEMADIPRISHAEERALADRARQGDVQAKEALILSLLPVVRSYAFRYHQVYRWQNTSLAIMDLVSVGNLALIEEIDAALEVAQNPHAYLTTAAYKAIRDYCPIHDGVIRSPGTPDAIPYAVGSLDRSIKRTEDGDETYADAIMDRRHEPVPTPDYQHLYDAISQLPQLSQDMLRHLYGLQDAELKTMLEIAGATCARSPEYDRYDARKRNTLKKLGQLLAPAYPQHAGQPKQYRYNYMSLNIPANYMKRLDRAYQALVERGEIINAKNLRTEAKIHSAYAAAYLYRLKLTS